MGRPTSYRKDFVEQARKLAALGATDREAAEFFRVSEATIHRWKHSHPEFCESLRVGKETADARVEQSLYRKATGYTFDSEKLFCYEGAVTRANIVEHVPPSDTAAIFWLKNRKPAEWRDVSRQEHTGADGAAIQIEQVQNDADAFRRRLLSSAVAEPAAGGTGEAQP